MSHIFKIRTQTVELELKGKTFRLVDPKFEDKVNIKQAWEDLEEPEKLNPVERLKKMRELNLRQIRAYIPSFTDDDVNGLSDGEIQLVIEVIMEAAALNFGAIVEKPGDAEKK